MPTEPNIHDLGKIHYWRNIEKIYLRITGALVAIAEKPRIAKEERLALAGMFDQLDDFVGNSPPQVVLFRELLEKQDSLDLIPYYAQRALGDAWFDIGREVLSEEDRRICITHGFVDIVKADGHIDSYEKTKLENLVSSCRSEVIDRFIEFGEVTSSPKEVTFRNKYFVLSGSFRLPKKEIHELIVLAGGQYHENLVKRSGYCVFATMGSKNSKNTIATGKIEKSLKYGVEVISEDSLFLALESAGVF